MWEGAAEHTPCIPVKHKDLLEVLQTRLTPLLSLWWLQVHEKIGLLYTTLCTVWGEQAGGAQAGDE